MQKIYTYGFWILLLSALLFAGIIINKDAEIKLQEKRDNFLEQQNIDLQNNIDNLNEDIDTLQKQANNIVYVTKIKQGKRDSIFVNIKDTLYNNIDTCNNVVKRLFSVCRIDKEIFRLKDSTITIKDSVIYKLEIQKGNYAQMVDNKNEINEHLTAELKLNKRQKTGQKIIIGMLGITSIYLLLNK
jgi:hypothetical protein